MFKVDTRTFTPRFWKWPTLKKHKNKKKWTNGAIRYGISLAFQKSTLPEKGVNVYLLFCIPSCVIELFTSGIGSGRLREGGPANLENYIQDEQALVITGRILVLVATVLWKKKNFKQKVILSCLNTVFSNSQTVF